jgi:Spy/CpxP family protein refolding chaperone
MIFGKGEEIMKKGTQGLRFILAVVMVMIVMGVGISHAQTKDAPSQTRTRRNRTIFDYKAQLQLTDTQVRDIKNILVDLARESRENRARLVLLDDDIRKLVNNDADLAVIRKKVDERGNILTTMMYQDIVSAREINKVLTPEQLKKWKEIKTGEGR